jgi:hypothetical protein
VGLRADRLEGPSADAVAGLRGLLDS